MAFGVTPQGFIIKTMDQIESEIDETLRTLFGTNINTGVASVFGQLKNIMAERESAVWEMAEGVYFSQYPNSASGSSLDDVCSISGVYRKGATKGTELQQAFIGTAGAIVPVGSVVANSADGAIEYITDTTITLSGPKNEKQLFSFNPIPTGNTYTLTFNNETTAPLNYNAVDTEVKAKLEALTGITTVNVTGDYQSGFVVEFVNPGNSQIYPLKIIVNTGLLVTVPAANVSATTDVEQLGTATANGVVSATAVSSGAGNFVPEGYMVYLPSAIPNVTSTFNLQDTLDGQDTETDAELRTRRDQTLALAGGCTPDAIVSELNLIPEVDSSYIVENEGSVDDAANRPPKCFETYVYVPTIDVSLVNTSSKAVALRETIAKTILNNKPGGILSFGSIPMTVNDVNGNPKTVAFTRPTPKTIWLYVMLQVDNTIYGTVTQNADTNAPTYSTTDLAIRDSLLAWGNAIGPGKDVIVYPDLINVIGQYKGIKDIRITLTNANPGSGFPPTQPATPPPGVFDSNISISPGSSSTFVEISTWSKAQIVVVSQTGVLP